MDCGDGFFPHLAEVVYRSAATRFFEMGSGPHDALFARIDTRDLVRLMQTCRRMRSLIQDTCFNVDVLLSPFFGDGSNVLEFRAMQRMTGALVSGSMALQFLNRSTWPASDLDLYVSHASVGLMVLFIVKNGYMFVPRQPRDNDMSVHWPLASVPAEEVSCYLGHGIAYVLDFHKGSRKLQVIVATTAPMEIILGFHSTCVMNVITADHAFALYPWSTFITKEALITESVGERQDAAREKYTRRGWTMITSPSLSSKSELGVRVARSVGDHFTWTVPLSPLALEIADIGPVAAWQLKCDGEITDIWWSQFDTVVPGATHSNLPPEEMASLEHQVGALRAEIVQLQDMIRSTRVPI